MNKKAIVFQGNYVWMFLLFVVVVVVAYQGGSSSVVTEIEHVPDGFNILTRVQHRAEIETDLTQKLVRPEPVIVPDCNLQNSGSEVAGSNPGVDEALVPGWVTGVNQRFRPAFRKLSVILKYFVHF